MSEKNTIEEICRRLLTGKELFLIFDRDGTLVPFSEMPEGALLDEPVRQSLNRLASCPGVHVGIMSARSISWLRRDLPDRKQILAGNYGLEIELPSGAYFCQAQAQSRRKYLEQALRRLEQNLEAPQMYILEDHGLSLCLHFHKTPVRLSESLHKSVSLVEQGLPQLYFKRLPTSYEVWTVCDWDKSHGLAKMFELVNFGPSDVTLLYAGDSRGDEPAFVWTNKHAGISVLVGKRDSEAEFALETPAHLHKLLGCLEQAGAARF